MKLRNLDASFIVTLHPAHQLDLLNDNRVIPTYTATLFGNQVTITLEHSFHRGGPSWFVYDTDGDRIGGWYPSILDALDTATRHLQALPIARQSDLHRLVALGCSVA